MSSHVTGDVRELADMERAVAQPASSGSAASTSSSPTPASPATGRCERSTRRRSSGSSTSTCSASSTPCARPCPAWSSAQRLRAGRLLARGVRRLTRAGVLQRQQGRSRALRQRAAPGGQARGRRRGCGAHVLDRHPAGARREGGHPLLRDACCPSCPTRSTGPRRSSPAPKAFVAGIEGASAPSSCRAGSVSAKLLRNLINCPAAERQALKHTPSCCPRWTRRYAGSVGRPAPATST